MGQNALMGMAVYRYRCALHGDFTIESPMATTTPTALCPADDCGTEAPKVLITTGTQIQFRYGRDTFHSGPEGTGETVKETADRWVQGARARGLDPEPTGYRHL